MRQGKDDVEVTGRKNLVLSFLKPSFPGHVLAFGAMPVSARVIGDAQRAAVAAAIDVTAKASGAAV